MVDNILKNHFEVQENHSDAIALSLTSINHQDNNQGILGIKLHRSQTKRDLEQYFPICGLGPIFGGLQKVSETLKRSLQAPLPCLH